MFRSIVARTLRVRHRRGLATSRVLDDQTKRLCQIAGYTASGNLYRLGKLWEQLPTSEHAAGSEIILQNMVYNGIPRTLMALTTICEIGLKDRIIVDQYPSSKEHCEKFVNQGINTCKDVYGYKYKRFLAQLRLLHPAYAHWVVEFLYGRVRCRPGVSQKVKQLCELAAIGGQFVLPQFVGGVMAALTCGAKLEEIRSVLDLTGDIWGSERQTMVDALWSDLHTTKLHGGWRMVNDDSVDIKKLVDAHTLPLIEDNLKQDWSHLRNHEQILTPPWRHPLVKTFRFVNSLPDRTRILALASAHTTSGNLSTLKRDWTYIQADDQVAGLEAVLQTVAFSGFHRVYNALRAVHENGVSKNTMNKDVEDQMDPTQCAAAGLKTLEAIYGSSLGPLQKSISTMHPDMWCWIVEFAYGRVLARDGLSIKERELAALPVLVGTATFPQLRSHMRGALLNGATIEQVRGILDQTEAVWGRPAQSYVDGFWLDFGKSKRPAKSAELPYRALL